VREHSRLIADQQLLEHGAQSKGTYLAAQYARLAPRRGGKRAAVAVAHSMLVSAYWMLVRDEPYQDLGPDWLSKRNDQAHTRRLVAQLKPRAVPTSQPFAPASARANSICL